MKIYQERINKRNEENNQTNNKISVKLKIFRQDTRPQMLQPMFFKRKTEI
jgi:hypothetical protein